VRGVRLALPLAAHLALALALPVAAQARNSAARALSSATLSWEEGLLARMEAGTSYVHSMAPLLALKAYSV
jgi:hypothetical protein